MAVTSTNNKIQYPSVSGSTTVFPFPYRFIANEHLVVLGVDAFGNTTTYVMGTDYTVTGAGNSSGGTVTFNTAPAAGMSITIYRNVSWTQATDYVNDAALDSDVIEADFDLAAMRDQQLNDALSRSITLPVTEAIGTTMVLPNKAQRAGKVVAFDSNGNIIAVTDIGKYRGVWATGVSYSARDLFIDSNSSLYAVINPHTSSAISADIAAGNIVLTVNAPAIATAVQQISPWGTGVNYTAGIIVYYTDNTIYRCITAHASGVFATDLSAGKWVSMGTGPIAANTILGNNTGASASPTALTVAQAQTLLGINGGGFKNMVVLTSSGSWTIPTGITIVKVTAIGGGGAGGGGNNGNNYYGAGGGAGGMAIGVLTGLTPGNTISATIGAGGAGVSGTTGGNGGNTTFSTLTANGGTGGQSYITSSTTIPFAGGAGGTASGGILNIVGKRGGYCVYQNGTIWMGAGADSLFGQGGDHTWGTGSNQTGNAATGYGAGGGGGVAPSSSVLGGAGSPGVIIIEY